MAVKLKAGESVIVTAMKGDAHPDQGLPKPEQPVDPGYGIDLGLGYLRPSHPIALPPLAPDNSLPVPPEGPVDPGWGIDVDIGYVRPSHPIVLPPREAGWEIKTAWTPETGWVVVAVPKGEHAAPSKRK